VNSRTAVEVIVDLNNIPASNANASIYSMAVQELASQLVNEVRLLHSSVTNGGKVPWRRAATQMSDARETMSALDKALLDMVIPKDKSNGEDA
jgi:hypothetical protein